MVSLIAAEKSAPYLIRFIVLLNGKNGTSKRMQIKPEEKYLSLKKVFEYEL